MNHGNTSTHRDTVTGTRHDDVIHGDGGSDWILGWDGDDLLTALDASGQAGLWGNRGDDTLIGAVPGEGQIHMSGAQGDDHIIMDVTNHSGVQGHHAYGGKGADKFEFANIDQAHAPIVGRIDDFDASQDSLWIDGNEIDLYDLPTGVDIVEYQDQMWLKIGDNILYALEGARDGGEERHFAAWPEELDELKIVEFLDHVNHVPFELFEDEIDELNVLYADNVVTNGTAGDDWIYDDKLNRLDSEGNTLVTSDSVLNGGGGDDVIEAGKGNDVVNGGTGDDLIAGGQDNDRLYGEAGDDQIWGDAGRDRLYGHRGDDTLYGGSGNDILRGGEGRDWLQGGTGDDVFSFQGGDLTEWSDRPASIEDQIQDLDIIDDFTIGEDKLSFSDHSKVEDLSDLNVWKVEIDENVLFMLQIPSTNERLLIDVEEDASWSDMMDEENFSFL
ncbi:MAG: Ca2+-binding RTX toxin-like protein [Celeribacter sp.]|jgi:Ca2+-binding RTX toxin-like protein